MASHSEAALYKSLMCRKISKRKADLRADERPHVCSICHVSFRYRHNLFAHMAIHFDTTHKCSYCEKTFKRRDVLKTHLKIHKSERPHVCLRCGKAFTNKHSLTAHLQVHSFTWDHSYVCLVCQRSFKQRSTLSDHMATHLNESLHKCLVCDRSFLQDYLLLNHIATHVETLFKCSHCGKVFQRKHDFTIHLECHKNLHQADPITIQRGHNDRLLRITRAR